MRDKRPVDELSIEELERVLAIRKREERQRQLQRMQRAGRVMPGEKPTSAAQPAPLETVQPALIAASAPAAVTPPPRTETVSTTGAVTTYCEDDEEGLDYIGPDTGESKREWRKFVNRSLLVVEVLAIFGLVFLGVNLIDAIDVLQRETANTQQVADEQRRATMPTIEPTPVITLSQVVLPGGHVYAPNAAPAFNYNEIPEHLLVRVQNEILQPVIARPVPTQETALRLIIPKLDLDAVIVQGVDWEALRLGIGQLMNGIDPADAQGNVVLAAHNDIYGELFRHLDELEAGDQFQIQTELHTYNYVITGWDIYEPTDVHVMNNREGPTATLISCYPYQVDNLRIVVFADRIG
jgi:sortase A